MFCVDGLAMIPGGIISFEEFMRRALHDPEHGYYARRIRAIGRGGDFTTAPKLSRAPAAAIARWAAAALRETGSRDLIEIGPGDGTLAREVMRRLPLWIRWRTRLHLVDSSAPLTRLQQRSPGLRSARWHRHPREALEACGGRAVIFSNELVDAFPARRFRKTEGTWREIGVALEPRGKVTEVLLEPAALPTSSSLDPRHPEGQVVEVHESYRRWLEDWLPAWRAGRMLTIDYGAAADTLYRRRPWGTVRGYLLHQRMEGASIYENIGRQDLTADVNFTDLMAWSAPWTCGQRLSTLGEFLGEACLVDEPVLHGGEGALEAFLVLDECRRAM